MSFFKLGTESASIFYDAKSKLKIVGTQVVDHDESTNPLGSHALQALQNGHITRASKFEYEAWLKKSGETPTPTSTEEPKEVVKDKVELIYTKEEVEDMNISELKEYAAELKVSEEDIKANKKKEDLCAFIINKFYSE